MVDGASWTHLQRLPHPVHTQKCPQDVCYLSEVSVCPNMFSYHMGQVDVLL